MKLIETPKNAPKVIPDLSWDFSPRVCLPYIELAGCQVQESRVNDDLLAILTLYMYLLYLWPNVTSFSDDKVVGLESQRDKHLSSSQEC